MLTENHVFADQFQQRNRQGHSNRDHQNGQPARPLQALVGGKGLRWQGNAGHDAVRLSARHANPDGRYQDLRLYRQS